MGDFELSDENYYSQEANKRYMSVSQFKQFAGTMGIKSCEFEAMEELEGRYTREMTKPMLVGSYVDRYFEGTLDEFKKEHPEVFTQKGELRSEYKKAEELIARVKKDAFFMSAMAGEKQRIMTGNIGGCDWKIKMDSYMEGKFIVDLKVVKAIHGKEAFTWVKDYGQTHFSLVWGYDIQGAVYQEIVRQNTGKKLPFYLACVSKQEEPDLEVIEITQNYLDEALKFVKSRLPRVLRVKNHEDAPDRCGSCECCRRNKVLASPIAIPDTPEAF